jgi:alpha-glucosidase
LTEVGGNKALQKLAVMVLLTFPGIPGIYYGNEIAMEDVHRMGSRGCMKWDDADWDTDMLEFYRRLIALRKESIVLQRGGFQVLAVENDTIAYQREHKSGRVLVVANRHARPAGTLLVAHGGIPNGTTFTDFFSGATVTVQDGVLNLPDLPQGAVLYVAD